MEIEYIRLSQVFHRIACRSVMQAESQTVAGRRLTRLFLQCFLCLNERNTCRAGGRQRRKKPLPFDTHHEKYVTSRRAHPEREV